MICRPLLVLPLLLGACLQPIPSALAQPAAPVAAPVTPIPTVIESAGPAEMVSTATETTFTFRDQVVVTATNLRLTCDRLIVVAKRTGDPKATLGKQENFKSLIATGHVHLVQNEREAFCERAEVLPGDDKVILTGNPATVRSHDGRYAGSGPEMTLLRGEQRAVIKAPRFVLPPIKDLGPGKEKAKAASPSPATPAAPAPLITVPIAPVPPQ
jgi:lipopolysaccharide export system protein LptA